MLIVLVSMSIVAALTRPERGPRNDVEVNVPAEEFGLPVKTVNIVKPYSATELQKNVAFDRFEIHRAVALGLNAGDEVMSIGKGVVIKIDRNMVDGNVITIEHADGVRSTYGSLADGLKVAVGDNVIKGTVLGHGGTTSARGADLGVHVRFSIEKNGDLIDPGTIVKLT